MMAWIRAGSTFSPQPLVGGIRDTTLGPFTPAGATWMWAPNAGAMLETEISQQSLACSALLGYLRTTTIVSEKPRTSHVQSLNLA